MVDFLNSKFENLVNPDYPIIQINAIELDMQHINQC